VRKSLIIFLSIVAFNRTIFAHRDTYDSANVKHPRGIYIGMSASFSGIDIYKNYFQNPHKYGYSPRVYWEFSNVMRLSAEFTRIPHFNFDPSWSNLRTTNLDLNLHFMARIKEEKSIFYLMMGICNHHWTGHFKQQSAYYDAIAYYKPGSVISENIVKMNLGAGMERAFKYFEIFAEMRYRFSTEDGAFTVTDVAANVGIKKKFNAGKLFRKLTDRYHWF
jgi:hypothetical protein